MKRHYEVPQFSDLLHHKKYIFFKDLVVVTILIKYLKLSIFIFFIIFLLNDLQFQHHRESPIYVFF